MAAERHKYKLEVKSDSLFCRFQNLYVCIATYNGNTEKPSSVSYGNACPATPGDTLTIEAEEPAGRITIAIYTVPQQYPESKSVAENPPYILEYKVYRDGKLIDTQKAEVDRWGGLQLVSIPYK